MLHLFPVSHYLHFSHIPFVCSIESSPCRRPPQFQCMRRQLQTLAPLTNQSLVPVSPGRLQDSPKLRCKNLPKRRADTCRHSYLLQYPAGCRFRHCNTDSCQDTAHKGFGNSFHSRDPCRHSSLMCTGEIFLL
jgi:hypothetical protein